MSNHAPYWLMSLLGLAARTPRGLAKRDAGATTPCTVAAANCGWVAVTGSTANAVPVAPVASAAFPAVVDTECLAAEAPLGVAA